MRHVLIVLEWSCVKGERCGRENGYWNEFGGMKIKEGRRVGFIVVCEGWQVGRRMKIVVYNGGQRVSMHSDRRVGVNNKQWPGCAN